MRNVTKDRSRGVSSRAWMDAHVVEAAAGGDRASARRVLEGYARRRRWSPDTLRGRLDGMGALLAFYWAVDSSPLDRLSRAEVTAFRDHLVRRGLASSTTKAYMKGARSMFDALHSARGDLPPLDHPFRGLPPVAKVNVGTPLVPILDREGGDARVALLHVLVAHGLSVAEASRLAWRDVTADHRAVAVVRRGVTVQVSLSPDARVLLGHHPRRDERVLGWGPDHARRMLNAASMAVPCLGDVGA